MEVNVEETGKLKRKLSVEVPLADVSAVYDEVYSSIKGNVRVDGFRPGRFPRSLIEKRFKDLMAREAMRDLVPRYFDQVLKEKNLRPATEPQFDNLDIDQKRPFRFDVEFEIMPEFDLPDIGKFTIEEKSVELEKGEVDERMESFREARGTLEEKGDEPAEKGDMATIDFEGTVEGEAFQGGTGNDQSLQLGEGRYLEQFETEMTGTKAGEEKTFDLTFPDDYGEEFLAGKTAQFKVKVKKVERRVSAELNEAFFSEFGEEIKTAEDFREFVEGQVTTEKKREIEQAYQNQAIEQIKAGMDFDVPESLIERGMAEFEHQLEHDDPEVLQDEAKLKELREAERKRRVEGLQLAYVLTRYAEREGVGVEPEELRNRFMLQAYMMRQNPEELARSPHGETMLQQLREQMLHQKSVERMVDAILGREPARADSPTGDAAPETDTPEMEASETQAPQTEAAQGETPAGAAPDDTTDPAPEAAKPAEGG